MWLLSTDRAELHYFARNFDAHGGYAILSHTWGGDEQSLQEVRAIAERCRANGTNPRDDAELSPKIRECCILAEKHGYRWVWIDSCCIDKTSSSELSEAINSMYKWYKSSEVCFAYLKDVPNDDVLDAPDSAFRKSRWHTRGWTLQELIAPDFLIFLSVDWRELGSRAELAELLEEITKVPTGVLTGVDRPAEWSASIRMSWASMRQTTRVEDEAYCLMGLFGVNMPTNYGEGKRAFIRLQYEIMQHKECDMSLFAFGYCLKPDDIICNEPGAVDRDNPWQYLLADSPRPFGNTFGYIPDLGTNAIQQYPPPLLRLGRPMRLILSAIRFFSRNSTTTGPFNDIELPHATLTSYGVQFRLPVATVDGVTVALLLCEGSGRHFGLFLTRDNRGKDPKRPRYFVGCDYMNPERGSATSLARLCDLGDDLYNVTLHGKRVKASWRTVYIIPTASDLDSESGTSPNLLINCNPLSRFHVPRWLVDQFIALGFDVDEYIQTETLQVVGFFHRSGVPNIFVALGTCTEHQDSDQPPPPWAKLFVVWTGFNREEFGMHNCSEDDLDSESWVTRSRVFGDANNTVRLSFRTLPMAMSEMTQIQIHLELTGSAFKDLLQAVTSFPSLAELERDSSSRPTSSKATLHRSFLQSLAIAQY